MGSLFDLKFTTIFLDGRYDLISSQLCPMSGYHDSLWRVFSALIFITFDDRPLNLSMCFDNLPICETVGVSWIRCETECIEHDVAKQNKKVVHFYVSRYFALF